MSRPRWHRTKIVCTLGPATDAPDVLARMVAAGMDIARVNLSHGSAADHARRIRQVRTVAQSLAQPVAVLTDLPGPKFRLAEIGDGARTLQEGAAVTLTTRPENGADLPVRNPELLDTLREGEVVFLADGAVELRITSRAEKRVSCEVVIGGAVRSGSGINVPESELGALVPTEADRAHLAFALEQGVEWVGVSFVQSAADLTRVRACFGAGQHALLMAKIEKRRALADLDAIVEAADGVMVARGDLGVETDFAQIALVQKRIIAVANARGRPVVTATQMLESMIEHEHPTRAEVTDVANAVLDGTDAVMLSGETAIGRHPAAAVQILDRVLRATEAKQIGQPGAAARESPRDPFSVAARELAAHLGARAIVAAIPDYDVATAIASTSPEAPLVMITASERLTRMLAVVRGVAPIHTTGGLHPDACVALAREWLFSRKLARPGERIVLLYGSETTSHTADTLRVIVLR